MDKLDRKITDMDRVAGLDAMQENVVEHSKFLQPFFGERQRKSRTVYRQVIFFENVGQGSDVVFVAVREDDRRKVLTVFLEKIKIRDRDIDAVWRFFRKAHARVD